MYDIFIRTFFTSILLNFVRKGPIDNKASVSDQVITWCRTGNKPLHESVMDYWQHMASAGHIELTHWPLGDLNEVLDK